MIDSIYTSTVVIPADSYIDFYVEQNQTPDAKIFYDTMLEQGTVPHPNSQLLTKIFGEKTRDLNTKEIRSLYNYFVGSAAISILEHVNKTTSEADLRELAESAFEARHSARHYTRSRGPLYAEIFAVVRDFFKYWSLEGPTVESTFKKYNNDSLAVIRASSRTNQAYNN